MALKAVIVFTVVSVTWSLWIRRITWKSSWEVAASLNIALQGVAVALMSPVASATLGVWLHRLTGEWNLEDYLAHDCYLVAASAVAFNMVGRLSDEATEARNFKLWVQTPATLCVPVLLMVFTQSKAVRDYSPDFFRHACGCHMRIYWTVLCATLIWIMAYAGRALLIVRADDQQSRKMATMLLLSLASGILACAYRIVVCFLPQDAETSFMASFPIWALACGCGIGFAISGARSWGAKTRWFTSAR